MQRKIDWKNALDTLLKIYEVYDKANPAERVKRAAVKSAILLLSREFKDLFEDAEQSYPETFKVVRALTFNQQTGICDVCGKDPHDDHCIENLDDTFKVGLYAMQQLQQILFNTDIRLKELGEGFKIDVPESSFQLLSPIESIERTEKQLADLKKLIQDKEWGGAKIGCANVTNTMTLLLVRLITEMHKPQEK